MARKRHGDEKILNLLHQIELSLDSSTDVATVCRPAGCWKTIIICLAILKQKLMRLLGSDLIFGG